MDDLDLQKVLDAAEGWLMLGLPEEALAELERLPANSRHSVHYFQLLWEVYSRLKRWDDALRCAIEWLTKHPDHPGGWTQRSYALHELGRTEEAYERLKEVANRFEDKWVIPYNLACYACRLRRLDEARQWLEIAIQRSSRSLIKKVGLRDPDLEELWPEMRQWED